MQSSCLTLPSKFQVDYTYFFQTQIGKSSIPHCFISSILSTSLDEAVLVALSSSAYSLAETDRDRLVGYLSSEKRILRRGTTLSVAPFTNLGNGHDVLRPFRNQYKIVSTEPVHQGFIDAIKTNIVVANGARNEDGITPNSPTSSRGFTASDDEQSDIDESFLLHTLSQPAVKCTQYNDESSINQEHSISFRSSTILTSSCISEDSFSDVTVLVRPVDLAKLSVFSGDWVSRHSFLSTLHPFIQHIGSSVKSP